MYYIATLYRIKALKRKTKKKQRKKKMENTTVWITIAVYVAVMIIIGIVSGRKAKSIADLTVGGRNAGAWLSALSYGTA